MLKIYIPTRGRVDRQVTLRSLPASLRGRTWLVAPKEEVPELKKIHKNVLTQPDEVTTIAVKREWIVKQHKGDKLIMLDDDCGFYARGPKGLIKEYATDAVIEETFQWVEDMLDEFAHVGLSSRMGNNRVEEAVKRTSRMMHAIAFHVPTMKRVVQFNRVAMREDFDYTLQLLRTGYDNIVKYDVCVAPGSYGAKGGCADERTVQKSDAEAEKLAKLHPGLVKVVQKDYLGVPRKEVVVQWKKALGFDQPISSTAAIRNGKLTRR